MTSTTTTSATTSGATKTPADFLVEGLEKVQPAYAEFKGKMYAGLLPINNNNGAAGKEDRVGEMMFWLFEPDTQQVEHTTVLWLNGGPGCSSFNCGVMMEHSPVTQPLHNAGFCCLKPTPELSYNEHAWTKATTMLYVEQPIGTGFSYGTPLPETEADASADLDMFLQNFYKVFAHLQPYDFFVFGESYAGMFVPSISRHIHLKNVAATEHDDTDRFIVPLKGAAIGNGWMDAKVQGPACIDYSWWHGLIDKPTRDALHVEFDNCMIRYGSDDDIEPPPFHPFNVQDDCGIMWGILQAAGNPNAYDITTWDPNVDQVTFTSEAFYNQEIVKTALHAPMNVTWHGCRQGEGRRRMLKERLLYMVNDRPLSVVPYVADLLDAGIPVLVYNGDRDMTTNMVGTELILNAMEWRGKDEWLDAPRGLWKVDDYPAGWAKEYKGLTFAVVYNSGHMVPYNAPTSAYDLLVRFMTKQSFIDDIAPLIRVEPILGKGSSSSKASSKAMFDTIVPDMTDAIGSDFQQSLADIGGGRGTFETVGMVAVSMFAGFVLALLFNKRRGASSAGRGSYQQVPNANLS